MFISLFTSSLVFPSFLPSVCCVIFCKKKERHWESYWTVDAIWEVLYLAVLLSVCFLLRPSMNTQRYILGVDFLSGVGGGNEIFTTMLIYKIGRFRRPDLRVGCVSVCLPPLALIDESLLYVCRRSLKYRALFCSAGRPQLPDRLGGRRSGFSTQTRYDHSRGNQNLITSSKLCTAAVS